MRFALAFRIVIKSKTAFFRTSSKALEINESIGKIWAACAVDSMHKFKTLYSVMIMNAKYNYIKVMASESNNVILQFFPGTHVVIA